jgi:hypothetical protein
MRRFPTTSCRYYEFRNVQYVPVEQRQFQAIRIEFLTLERLHIPFDYGVTPTKVVLHFRKNYQWLLTYKTLRQQPSQHSLRYASVRNILSKSGRSRSNPSEVIGFVYAAPVYLRRVHGIGNLFGSLFRCFRPILRRGPKLWSRDVAYRRQDPNRHCREQFSRIEHQGFSFQARVLIGAECDR